MSTETTLRPSTSPKQKRRPASRSTLSQRLRTSAKVAIALMPTLFAGDQPHPRSATDDHHLSAEAQAPISIIGKTFTVTIDTPTDQQTLTITFTDTMTLRINDKVFGFAEITAHGYTFSVHDSVPGLDYQVGDFINDIKQPQTESKELEGIILESVGGSAKLPKAEFHRVLAELMNAPPSSKHIEVEGIRSHVTLSKVAETLNAGAMSVHDLVYDLGISNSRPASAAGPQTIKIKFTPGL